MTGTSKAIYFLKNYSPWQSTDISPLPKFPLSLSREEYKTNLKKLYQ
jgi:hypothetical protein